MKEIETLNFFGKEGITSTSANHIANLAKESVRNAHQKLSATKFYTESVGLLTSDKSATVNIGMDSDTLNDLPKLIDLIVQANSLIAYFREAIKEKDRRLKEAKEYNDSEAYENLVNLFDNVKAEKPVKAPYPTEEDIKKTWSIGEQEKYLSLGAEAAALGKAVHEDGYLSYARIDLMHKLQNPVRVELNGTNTIVHSFNPTVALSDVDNVYNTLQARFRSVQAELNGMNKQIADTILSRSLEIDNAYNFAMREYNARVKEWQNHLDDFHNEMEKKRKELVAEVQALKIVIPKRLRPIYDKLVKSE